PGPKQRPTPVPRTGAPRPGPQLPGTQAPGPQAPGTQTPGTPPQPVERPGAEPGRRSGPLRPAQPGQPAQTGQPAQPDPVRPAARADQPAAGAAPEAGGERRNGVHRNEVAPVERRSRTSADGRSANGAGADGQAVPGAAGRSAGAVNGSAPADQHTAVSPGDGDDAAANGHADGLTTSERSLHASTVAVRVVALAAVAPPVPVGAQPADRRRARQPEQTEAS
ncbi:hypothetical protein ACFPBZ_27875, partial [Actinomycetospora atypica]